MIKNYKKLFTIVAFIIFLTGCGFIPYTAKSLPPQLHQVYLQTERSHGQFEASFKRNLKRCGTTLLPTPKEGVPIIHLAFSQSDNNRNPASSVQARVYNLTCTATIGISDSDNKQLLPVQVISVSRNVTLQTNEVFETTPQVDIVRREMLQELSIKALRILSSRKTFQALQHI